MSKAQQRTGARSPKTGPRSAGAKAKPGAPKTRPPSPKGPNRAARRRGSGSLQLSRAALGWVSVGVVVVIVAAFVIIKAIGGGSAKPNSTGPTGAALAKIVQQATHIPATAFDAVGVPAGATAPVALPAGTSPLVSGALPRVAYIGAEYCPFCAGERWAVVVALSRFGTFSGLGASYSSLTDTFPGTKTFSFHGSSFQSQYVAFTGIETETNTPAPGGGYTTLDTLSPEERQILQQFDKAPYSSNDGAIPFLDIANKYVLAGAGVSPQLLEGLSMAQIAQRLQDPSDPIAQAVIGHANLLTAAICKATGGQPGEVCSSAAVTQATGHLPSA